MERTHIKLLSKEKDGEEKDVVAYCGGCTTEAKKCDPDGDGFCTSDAKCFDTTP